jgi:hypothetical protein
MQRCDVCKEESDNLIQDVSRAGQKRGMICSNCSVVVTLFEDIATETGVDLSVLLQRAKAYLERRNASQ